MKKLILSLTAILILGSVVFVSCKKDDVTAPVIALVGDANMTIMLGATFTDPGATATDDTDGDLTSAITVSGTVNNALVGSYTLTYTVADAAGNSAEKKRTVEVQNSAKDFAGSYNVTDVVGGGTPATYTDVVTASSTVDKRVWVTKFAYYTNGGVYFDINTSNSTIQLPSQTVVCGLTPASRVFVGSGTYVSSPTTVLTINYTETTGGTSVTGVETYTKQ
ncbi:MAG: DUF5011 domain-containing protein [Bacteroidota bacterium]